jgi:hypothetical protein
MSLVKRFVCLANSRKLSGRCIAGKELVENNVGGWLRPVSSRQNEEVSEHERQYEDGSDPRVLDIIDIPLLEPKPASYQQENWLLDPDYYWTKAGKANWSNLKRLVDPVEPLWTNGNSTYHGRNDRIEVVAASALTSSLRLIHVGSLTISVFAPGAAFGNSKRRVQGWFNHNGSEYRLWVTDPIYERAFLAKQDGIHKLAECFVTLSIGEPANDGCCYKLIAAIVEKVNVK